MEERAECLQFWVVQSAQKVRTLENPGYANNPVWVAAVAKSETGSAGHNDADVNNVDIGIT